ncbi:MAG TPA: cbb3-type cytochrome c oxidase subunit I [Acidimicrobiales bacterium]|nr:cbb3-type cytochrome c oxidase subunit I [Acidimicrobiales bacterium]
MTITESPPDAPSASAGGRPPGTESLAATADHKYLGLLFLGGAFLFLIAAGVVGMVLRAELVSEGVSVVDGKYGRLFSLHATVGALLFLPAAWIGLATYVVPLQLGAGRLALARLHAFATWVYLTGGLLLVAAYILGPPQGLGIVSATPVAAPKGGATHADALAIVAMAMVSVAMVLASIDLAVTVLKMRTEGLTLRRVPMFSWAMLVSSLVTIFATPVFVGGLVLFYLDQRLGGTFFRVDNTAGHTVWLHTVWLYGRPEIYLLLLPGLGAACDIVATHARRPLLNRSAVRTSVAAFGVLAFGSWAASAKMAGALVLPTFNLVTSLVLIPLGVVVLVCLATAVLGHVRLHPSVLFVIGGVGLLAVGALHALIAAVAGVHGGAWTTGHLHTVAFGAPTLLLLGGLYHWAPKLFGRELSAGIGRLAFLGTFGGFFLMGLGSYLLGYDGAPAHVRDFDFSSSTGTYSLLAALGAVVVLVGVLAMVADMLTAVVGRGTASGPDDPYEGLTLEWATSSPPPAAGFDAVPEVRSPHPLLDLRAPKEASRG